MEVLPYWELDSDMDPSDIVKAAETLIKKGLCPAKGVKQTAFYMPEPAFFFLWRIITTALRGPATSLPKRTARFAVRLSRLDAM